MGQQQLLLIVLGVIIVGVAIVVGINLFNANAEQAAKDTVVAEATNIGALAQQYFKKPEAMGGGGGDFDGFGSATVPASLLNSETAAYTITASGASCSIEGDPTDATYGWTVTTTVTATGITSSVGTGT